MTSAISWSRKPGGLYSQCHGSGAYWYQPCSAKVIDRLSHDLRVAFPGSNGYSPRNLKYMRALAEAWSDPEIVQQQLHKLPWFHLCTILDKMKEPAARDWYLRAAIEYGWSRSVLVM